MSGIALCGLCGQLMPKGEEMFKYHGYSCDCPAMPLRIDVSPSPNAALQAPTTEATTAPSQEGVGRGEPAVAAPTPRTDALHFRAAFINAIAEEGTKQEAIAWLQQIWNERCQLKRELAAAEAENQQWRTWGTIEVAIRNPSVAESMRPWEGRAEKAEAALADAMAQNLRIMRGTFGQICSYCGWESGITGGQWDDLQSHIRGCEHHPLHKAETELAEAQAEIARLREDAERYCAVVKLCKVADGSGGLVVHRDQLTSLLAMRYWCSEAEFTAAIDAARKETK